MIYMYMHTQYNVVSYIYRWRVLSICESSQDIQNGLILSKHTHIYMYIYIYIGRQIEMNIYIYIYIYGGR